MAAVNAARVPLNIGGASLRQVTFSGTVKLAGVGVVRDIKAYKIGVPETVYETTSDSSGNWSLVIPAGPYDTVRIIVVGASGENSEIYDHLQG